MPDRPRVLVNCAMSVDGKIALPSREQTRISSDEDLARVHRLREESGAVLVGVETVLADDPTLRAKKGFLGRAPRRQPLRVVLDSRLRTPATAKVLDGKSATLLAVAEGHVRKLPHAEVKAYGSGPVVDLGLLLADLAHRGITSLLVEGGSTVIGAFLRARLVDELDVFVGHIVIGGSGPSLAGGPGALDLASAVRLRLIESKPLAGGLLLRYRPEGSHDTGRE